MIHIQGICSIHSSATYGGVRNKSNKKKNEAQAAQDKKTRQTEWATDR